MAEIELSFEDFLSSVDERYRDFVGSLHAYLLENGCKTKLQTNKSGEYIVSYQHGKAKKTVLNYVFRKAGLLVRIYADNTIQYIDFMDTLPDKMVQAIEKSASNCKKCNARCPKGYEFVIRGNEYFKCRYNSFMFTVDDDNNPFIRTFLENEIAARSAQ